MRAQEFVQENMDHSKDGRAVPELRAALLAHQDRLQKASDDQVYDIIDRIMTRIARSHSISGQRLHDMWVKKYKEIPDTWIMHQQLDEGAAEHVRMVMNSATDLMKQHGFRAVGQLSEKDLEQIAQYSGATLHDVCIILNIDHVDQQLDELALQTTLPVTREPSSDGYWKYNMKTESGEYQLHFYIENKDENYDFDPDYDGPTGYALRVFFLGKTPDGRWIQFNTKIGEKEVLKIFATIAQLAAKIVKDNPIIDEIVISGADQQRNRIYTRLMQQNASRLLPGWAPGGDGLVKQGTKLDELSFLGSPCTKDCSGHRAGYEWSKSKGGQVAQSPFSPSFNKGSQLHVDGK